MNKTAVKVGGSMYVRAGAVANSTTVSSTGRISVSTPASRLTASRDAFRAAPPKGSNPVTMIFFMSVYLVNLLFAGAFPTLINHS